ncbi:hypothetical protein APHAL10511_003316 [Amanita phalloides]|nr:hypothetical protein APHAL10511_003316 [Amanita phalloides]
MTSTLQKEQYLINLPVRLQERIIVQFMRDPDTTFKQLKTLRLVCKALDDITAPKVLANIRLFKNDLNVPYNFSQLRTLLSTKKSRHLRTTKTLRIEQWAWLNGSYFTPYVKLPNVRQLVVQNILLALLYPVYGLAHPHYLHQRVYNHCLRRRTKQLLTRTPRINLPNVRCVHWKVDRREPKWMARFTVELLLQLPQLDELVLTVKMDHLYFEHVFNPLCKLHNLRKLKIYLPSSSEMARSSQITCVGQFVAGNPNLTHLDVCLNSQLTIVELLGFVPADQPLKLQHIGIRWLRSVPAAVAPHIRSLVSVYFGASGCLDLFLAEGVFPPVMGTYHINKRFIDYLNLHPGITSLKLDCELKEEYSEAIFTILARHSKTLTHFSAIMHNFTDQLANDQNELLFLQCTNLKELVLDHDRYKIHRAFNQRALSIVAQLPRSLTVVLVYLSYRTILKDFVDHCKTCQDSRIDDLARRTVARSRYSQPLWYKILH